MDKPFRQKCEAGNGRLEGTAVIVPGETWFVRAKNGRTFLYYDERHFRSVWRLVGKPQEIQGDGWSPPAPDYNEEEEKRIAEKERLEEETYEEKVCMYVIKSQECMERHGSWKPPSTKFKNQRRRTI